MSADGFSIAHDRMRPHDAAVDVSAVALADTQVTVTLAEYGNATLPTWRVRATAFIDLDRAIANIIGYNAGLSVFLLDCASKDEALAIAAGPSSLCASLLCASFAMPVSTLRGAVNSDRHVALDSIPPIR